MDERNTHFADLSLMVKQNRYPDAPSLVDVYEVMDLEIILANHPNWQRIRQLPPLFVHDNPYFIDDKSLPAAFFNSDEIASERLTFSDKNADSSDGKKHSYHLLLFSTADPVHPIAYGAMELSILADWQICDKTAGNYELGLQLEFLHTFVTEPYSELGLSKLLGFSMGDIFWHQLQHVLQQLEQTDLMLRPIIIGHEYSCGGNMIVESVEREMRMMSKLFEKQERDFRLENTLVNFPERGC